MLINFVDQTNVVNRCATPPTATEVVKQKNLAEKMGASPQSFLLETILWAGRPETTLK